MLTRTATLTPVAPFDFEKTARYATHGGGDDAAQSYDLSRFTRLLEIDGYPILATLFSSGSIEAPCLDVTLTANRLSGKWVPRLMDQVSRLLGVDQDLAGFYAMASGDPLLASLVTQLRGLHLPQTNSIHESIVQSIIGQQISAKVARMVRSLLVQMYGATLTVDGATYHGFPSPQALVAAGVQGLREVKLSQRKAEYIVDISRAVVSGMLNLEDLRMLHDDEVVDQVVKLRGVGTWTAQWLLVNALGREDGFPSGDLMLQKILVAAGANPVMDRDAALRYSTRWSPYRSYATIYLFAGLQSGHLREFGLG
jgi:DNA-3-methyladenine glycosylase II